MSSNDDMKQYKVRVWVLTDVEVYARTATEAKGKGYRLALNETGEEQAFVQEVKELFF